MSSSRNPLSPGLSERLKPDKDRHHLSNRDHHDFHRRRHHRRANKRGRRHRPRDRSPQQEADKQQARAGRSSGGVGNAGCSNSGSCGEHRRPPASSKNLVLRPTKGPLLNAPKNSTQFIIDDHAGEFDSVELSPAASSSNKKYNTRSRQASTSSSSRRVSASEEALSPQSSVRSPDKVNMTMCVTSSTSKEKTSWSSVTSNAERAEKQDCQATPGNYVVNDDDYTLWAEFSERDFQSVYESAHQEQVADWDRHRLIEEITNLEKRQKELINVLARVDPEMYAQRLESQLQNLQEKNRLLRSANGLSASDDPMEQQPEVSSKSRLSQPLQESPDSSTKE